MQIFQLDSIGTYAEGFRRNTRFTPDGRYLYVDGASSNFLDTLGEHTHVAITDRVYGFAKNSRQSVGYSAGPWGRDLIVTDLRTKKRVTRELKDCRIEHGVVSPDGTLLYTAVGRSWVEWEVRVFGVASLRKRYAFGCSKAQLYHLALSANGNRLAGLGFDAFKIWDVASQRAATRPPIQIDWSNNGVLSYALSHDGAQLAAVNRSGLTIWSTATGEQMVRSGKHRRGVTAVTCAPTQPILATGDNAGHVFLWDYTGRVLTKYNWKLREITSLAFAPDGLRCAAVDVKGKVVIWDLDP